MKKTLLILCIIGLINCNGLFGQQKKFSKSLAKLEWSDARNHIFPLLKMRLTKTDSIETNHQEEFDSIFAQKYNDDIQIVYLLEHKDFMILLYKGQIKKWGISPDSLSINAIKNLDNLAERLTTVLGDTTFAMIRLNGLFDASLILSKKFWTLSNGFGNNKNLLVGIPNKNSLFVTHTDSQAGIQKMRSVIKEYYAEGNYLVSNWIYKYENGLWLRFEKVE